MKNTVQKIMKDDRYNMACTYIVKCMGETEIFTREQKNSLIRVWGLEEANAYFLNTREVIINIH